VARVSTAGVLEYYGSYVCWPFRVLYFVPVSVARVSILYIATIFDLYKFDKIFYLIVVIVYYFLFFHRTSHI
jgi:hypothetical protein